MAALFIAGPMLWLVGLVVLGYVVRTGREVGVAIAVLAAAFLVSVVLLIPMRARRAREEAETP